MNHLKSLLQLKGILFQNGIRRLRQKSRLEFFTLIGFFALTAAGFFAFFFLSFRFFRAQEPFGPILLDEIFYLFTFSVFLMLFLSSAVSAYASLFRSREIPFLMTHTVSWPDIYFLKLSEATWLSSWGFLLIAVPFIAAYGVIKEAGLAFPILCFLFFIPLVSGCNPARSLTSTVLAVLLPDRKRRRLALFAGIGLILFLYLRMHPALIREQGSLAGILSGYLPHVSFAKHPLLPSSWVTRGILSLSLDGPGRLPGWNEGIFYFTLLVSNMFFFFIPSLLVAGRLYAKGYLTAQDFIESRTARQIKSGLRIQRLTDKLKWPPGPVMGFIEKDIKTFVRDPAEWSQLIIFFGLLLLYFANLRNLEFHILKDFWKNMIFVLNTVCTYIVLSSFSMRFVFPMISLEGSRFWIVNLSPVKYAHLLLEKFVLGTLVSLILTVPLIFLSGWMLGIPGPRLFFTAGLGFFVCIALTGLSVGFGARFPNFRSDNPAKIISGLGGSLLLAAHLGYLGLIGVFLMVTKDPHGLVFCAVAAASLLVGMIPIKIGSNALRKMEF